MLENTHINIYVVGEPNKELNYAAMELSKYLRKLYTKVSISSENKTEYAIDTKGIYLGTLKYFKEMRKLKEENNPLKDGYDICIKDMNGYIAGVNERSVLLGVYRYLVHCGCKFIRPGVKGEYIPQCKSYVDAEIIETPDYDHRGICIEGAVSYENLRDIIEWSPKIGYNSYFIQFKNAYPFLKKWYSHEGNEFLKDEALTYEKAEKYTKSLEGEIKKRNLIYHGVGHGWTCDPLGFPVLEIEKKVTEVPKEIEKYLALVKGKREFSNGIPVNTNLCYSNKKVRSIIINEIVDYLSKNPQLDILHFWLADGTNNHCECDECVRERPSYYYVKMLKELDEALTLKNIKTKIAFLIYVDLLWAPEVKEHMDEDRFIMMFAPITREYNHSFQELNEGGQVQEYKRNHLDFPKKPWDNLLYLKEWKKHFSGDAFDFDYHLVWEHFFDLGYIRISRTLYEDILALKDNGLNGMISCQMNRAFMPHSLPNYVMAKTLWNRNLSFNEIKKDYFKNTFGNERGSVYENYFQELSECFCAEYARGDISGNNIEAAKNFEREIKTILEFRPLIIEDLNKEEDIMVKESYNIALHHSYFAELYCNTLLHKSKGEEEKAINSWRDLKNYLYKNELEIKGYLDVYHFIQTLENALKLKGTTNIQGRI